MTTKKHPRDLTADEADALVSAFDDHSDDEYSVTDAATLRELRAAAAAGPVLTSTRSTWLGAPLVNTR